MPLMRVDYHVHSSRSFDCKVEAEVMCRRALALGVNELCFTNHVDFDWPNPNTCDVARQTREVNELRERFAPLGLTVLNGVEVGLDAPESGELARESLRGMPLDFIIGSVHMVNGVDSYYPDYFFEPTKLDNYRRYIRHLEQALRALPEACVLGHYDFVAKYAPYDDRLITYDMEPDAFDSLFRYIVGAGKAIEINTAAWQDSPRWGLDVLTRYRELGGEYVTVGSDAHLSERLSRRFLRPWSLRRRRAYAI